MEYGPCGGVEADGRCEVAAHPCVFLGRPPIAWAGLDRATLPPPPSTAVAEGVRMRELLATRPIVLADLPTRPTSSASIRRVGEILAGRVDAVLAGDSPRERIQFPPAYRSALLRGAGLTPWNGLNGRDRNRVALEGELAALADLGVGGVHCVTGDHPLGGGRPDAAPVFDLDSLEIAALAVSAGHLVSVGESPATTPTEHRAARLVEKLATGAEVCIVNHCGGAAPARRFVEQVLELGGRARFVACVPVVVDEQSAALLQSFPALVLPDGFLAGIRSAADPRRAGIEAAVRLAGEMLDAGFDGVDLSGAGGEDVASAEALGTIADRLALAG
jgi:5,10-methylenetetrahydrofolate reductase